ncbi:MAG TPA: hypothetical protein VK656_00485, partial [Candidatus Acidoferrum sp.]|nr:hypothetical protein [Candidatus Acidoferrum sp.]
MPEILTESFCERCGTRYTFQAAATARGPLTRVKTLTKGFKNYVLSDETSMSEAMASARSDDLRRTSGEQLDAFHKAFNFCMSCRQYTCANCWNDIEGRCLSCSPEFDSAALATPFPRLDEVVALPQLGATNGNGHVDGAPNGAANGHVDVQPDGADISAWPSIDLEPEGSPTTLASSAPPAVADAVPADSVAPAVSAPVVSPETFAETFGAAS